MGGGYVLDFSNRTFQEFILENTGYDIYDAKYSYGSGSKANRLRGFWQQESNYLVGKLMEAMLEYWRAINSVDRLTMKQEDGVLYDECLKVAERLKKDVASGLDAIKPNADDKDFNLLAKAIKESIEKNEPEFAIDRLHTFVVRYIRELCDQHSIPYGKNIPLHGLFGAYVKKLREENMIESEMSERILKSSIAVLEAFNDVRNNKSFAHGNPVLNHSESVLIFNGVANLIRFIESVESIRKAGSKKGQLEEINLDDIPF